MFFKSAGCNAGAAEAASSAGKAASAAGAPASLGKSPKQCMTGKLRLKAGAEQLQLNDAD